MGDADTSDDRRVTENGRCPDEVVEEADTGAEQHRGDPSGTWWVTTKAGRTARELAARTGAVTVLVSHRFSTVRMADLIVVLDDGRVVEVGTHPQLLDAGGRYAELFTLQARAYR